MGNLAIGFTSIALYIASVLVYFNRYNNCGGDPCAGGSDPCPAVCVPSGIKYYITIIILLLIVATALAANLYRRLDNKRTFSAYVALLLVILSSMYVYKYNVLYTAQNLKYRGLSYQCDTGSDPEYAKEMLSNGHTPCLVKVYIDVGGGYISGDELTTRVRSISGAVVDAEFSDNYGRYIVAVPFKQERQSVVYLSNQPETSNTQLVGTEDQ